MSAALLIERAGPQTLIVDRGRFGHRHDGLAWCGPADDLAYEAVNAMLGNPPGTAALELFAGEVRMRFIEERAFSIAGAAFDTTLDGRRCRMWGVDVARRGSVLRLRPPARGLYAYIGIAGGIGVAPVLGSRTTDRAARLGGMDGRALRDGDVISLCSSETMPSGAFAIAPPQRRTAIRVVPCGQWEAFDSASRRAMWSQQWRVHHASNRMGYRLCGTPLAYVGEELTSHAVFPGVIQVPPSGEPIVLLADAQTTGGYPKAGVVIDADLRHVAQTRPGELIGFVEVTHADAIEATRMRREYLQTIYALSARAK